MRVDKDLAKKQIDVYGQLLLERAVISDITSRGNRDEQVYSFNILKSNADYPVECFGTKELALVLTSMWSSYEKAREVFDIS